MTQTDLLHTGRSALPRAAAAGRFLGWRTLVLACGAGVASAAVGQVLGRSVHLAWPIPASGSVVAALPRALILLALLTRVNRFGVLTAAALAEAGTRLALGTGAMWPISVAGPVLGNLAGDVLWHGLRALPLRPVRLMLTGAGLCAARVLIALAGWSVLGPMLLKVYPGLGRVHVGIVAINVVAGVIGGLVIGLPRRGARVGSEK